jgi:hypothetical protein
LPASAVRTTIAQMTLNCASISAKGKETNWALGLFLNMIVLWNTIYPRRSHGDL